MNQSCSECNSDSLNDDEKEEELIENQSVEIMKPKSKSNTSKQFILSLFQNFLILCLIFQLIYIVIKILIEILENTITLQSSQKSKLESKCSPKTFSKQTKMYSVESYQNKTQQLCQSPTPQINLKDILSRSQSKQQNEITKYITNYINQQFDYIDLLENPSNLNQSMQQQIQALMPRPSTSQLEGLDDERFTPIQGLNSCNQSVSKRHTRLHSYLTVNKQKKNKNTNRSTTKSPPFEIPKNRGNTHRNNTQTNSTAINSKLQMNISQEPNKIFDSFKSSRYVPPSFYSVRRHMIKRLKS